MKKPLNDKPNNQPVELSVIILTFNNEQQIIDCLNSLYQFNQDKFQSGLWELIIIDNNSTDHTIQNLNIHLHKYPHLRLIVNSTNLGFGPGNNLAAKKAQGKYVLFLNPDTVVEKESLTLPLDYLKNNSQVGAASVKLILGNGQIDMTCHRGFPTPWNSFCYFSGLSKIFPRSPIFSGYTLGNLDLNAAHEVDAINGAFFMMPSSLGKKLDYFDENFYWKGEDLDLCFRIREQGYKIMYLPGAIVHHFKGSSKGHRRGSRTLIARFEVMKMFYQKHYDHKYPMVIKFLVFTGIKLRYLLAYLSGR